MSRPLIITCLLLTLAIGLPAFADPVTVSQLQHNQPAGMHYITYSNGTGFFVTKDGYIVTNAHVVRNCQSLVHTVGAIETDAQIIARDDVNDLALLQAEVYAPSSAFLRSSDSDFTAGQDVVVMGYPGASGATGHVSFVRSKLISPTGPTGQPQWMQFANAAQHGNSGGPLLDMSGHVIGVITGKTQTFRVDKRTNAAPTMVSQSDVAITLATLKNFLNRNRVRFQTSSSNLAFFSDDRLQYDAKNYILQLKCVTAVANTPPSAQSLDPGYQPLPPTGNMPR